MPFPQILTMKTNLRLLAVFLATAAAAVAAPLTATTAVHTKPDEASAAVTFLKAGSEPVAAPEAPATTPAGWMAVELPGPLDGYVQNHDIMKNLDVRVGAPIYLAPKADAGELTTMEKADKADITGLYGKWTQVRLQRKLLGYIHLVGTPGYPSATSSAGVPPDPNLAAPNAYGVTTAGRPAPMVNLGDGGSSILPRFFQGRFVSTRNPFRPRRPYDWALNDDAGDRYAYLDVSKLLLTEQIDKYTDRVVVVYGAARSLPDRKDIVIEVESLQLK